MSEKANPDSILPDPEISSLLLPCPDGRANCNTVHESSSVDYGRLEALPLIKQVRERLESWRDDAAMRLERAPPSEEEPHRNLRYNYGMLAELLLQAELALGAKS